MAESEELQKSPEQVAFEEWRAHPVTRKLFEFYRARQELLKNQWAAGRFTDVHKYAMTILNAKAIGQVEILERLLELEASDLFEPEET